MLKYFVEFIGTFVFLSVILTSKKPVAIAVALLSMIYLGGHISGANFNPAVSVAMYLNEKLESSDLAGYVLAQLAGAAAAVSFYKYQKDLQFVQ